MTGNHSAADHVVVDNSHVAHVVSDLSYDFENFFHPFVGDLLEQLNTRSLPGLFDADHHRALEDLNKQFFSEAYGNLKEGAVAFAGKRIDLEDGPYANYNWELLFHFPFAVAVHLSKNQRFAEAQRWFHYIF